ncbi:MAG: hypothetical protein WD267_06215 [Balneolales bacterium]
MNDYTDLMLAMGAMVIFSILLMNTNRSMLSSDKKQVEIELEHTAIALAQGVIDEMRVKSFEDIDEASSTYGQTMDGSQVPETASFSFVDMVTVTWEEESGYGEYDIEMDIYYVNRDFPDVNVPGPTDYQRIDVEVSSKFITNQITLSYIKSRYQ